MSGSAMLPLSKKDRGTLRLSASSTGKEQTFFHRLVVARDRGRKS
jgi:hypothetical protein